MTFDDEDLDVLAFLTNFKPQHLGVQATLHREHLNYLDQEAEKDAVREHMCHEMAMGVLRTAKIQRCFTEVEYNPMDPYATLYRLEMVWMTRQDWKNLQSTITRLLRERQLARQGAPLAATS